MAPKKQKTELEKDIDNIIMAVDEAYANRDDESVTSERGTFSTRRQGATISAKEIDHAAKLLMRGIYDTIDLPDIKDTPSNWAMALGMALMNVFRVKITEGGPSHSSSHQPITLQLHFPLGQHSYDQNITTSLGFSDVLDNVGGSDHQKILRVRHEMCKQMVNHAFDSLTQWVDIAKNAKRYTVKELLAIENIEQRMAAMRIFGPEKLIQEAGAVLLDKSKKGNELFMIPKERKLFDEDAYFLKYQCPSTGRIYVSGVPPELYNAQRATSHRAAAFLKEMEVPGAGIFWRPRMPVLEQKYYKVYPKECWADLGMAWKFRLTLEEYWSLTRTNEG
jgi:hypothetical protein